ncbi:MAG: hypothetical protein WBC83_00045 [Minisyncoccia bacterium]
MDKDYTIIAVLIVISAIAVLAAKVYFGNTAAGLTTIAATILVAGKCILVLMTITKREKNARFRKSGSADDAFAPVGKMSQFP